MAEIGRVRPLNQAAWRIGRLRPSEKITVCIKSLRSGRSGFMMRRTSRMAGAARFFANWQTFTQTRKTILHAAYQIQ